MVMVFCAEKVWFPSLSFVYLLRHCLLLLYCVRFRALWALQLGEASKIYES